MRYMALCKRHTPAINSGDLDDKTKRQVRLLLNIEIERIRAGMNLMTDEIKVRMKKKAPRSGEDVVDARLTGKAVSSFKLQVGPGSALPEAPETGGTRNFLIIK